MLPLKEIDVQIKYPCKNQGLEELVDLFSSIAVASGGYDTNTIKTKVKKNNEQESKML